MPSLSAVSVARSGLVRYAVQGYLTALVLNLKLLCGVCFRNQPQAVPKAA